MLARQNREPPMSLGRVLIVDALARILQAAMVFRGR
jgi:hypothetical protein